MLRVNAFNTGIDGPEFALLIPGDLIMDNVAGYGTTGCLPECGNMNKYVPAGVIGGDKAKAPIFFPSF